MMIGPRPGSRDKKFTRNANPDGNLCTAVSWPFL